MINKYENRFIVECLHNSATQNKTFMDSVRLIASEADAAVILPEVCSNITPFDLCNAHEHVQFVYECGYSVGSYDAYIVEHYLLRVGSEYAKRHGLI